jgi:rhamnogalacturonyl hydrolase YesR
MNKRLFLSILFSGLLVGLSPMYGQAQSVSEIIDIITKVNNHWQSTYLTHPNAFWHPAAYHTGNMEAYFVTGNEAYRKYSEAWAIHNQWKGAKSDDRATWRYKYGETDDYVLFGDWQICFQTYIDLYLLDPTPENEYKIARAKEVMEYQMFTPNKDYWWWADGLYMVMPVMTKLYNVTRNELYLEKLYEHFRICKGLDV